MKNVVELDAAKVERQNSRRESMLLELILKQTRLTTPNVAQLSADGVSPSISEISTI